MSLLLLKNTSVELSCRDDSFPIEGINLVLQVNLNGGTARVYELFPRKSSPGVWDANPILGLPDASGEFGLSVSMVLDGNARRVLGSIELNGPDFYEGLGETYEIPLMSHEDHYTLIIKAKISTLEDTNYPISDRVTYKTPSGGTEMMVFTKDDDLIPDDEPEYIPGSKEIDRAFIQLQRAADKMPRDNPRYLDTLSHVGIYLYRRFERLGDASDLSESISRLERVVNLTPDGDTDKPSRLNNLGNSIEARFDKFGNLADLNEAITLKRAAVDLISDSEPKRPAYLKNLGTALTKRFERLGNLADIDNAVTLKKAAVDLTSDHDPNKPDILTSLGNALEVRFTRLGNIPDIDGAVMSKQAAVHLIPDGSPSKPDLLTNLGSSLMTRFQRLKDITDINEAIRVNQEAVNHTPDGYFSKARCLGNLGNSFAARFGALRDPADNDAAVELHQAAVDLLPDDDPRKPGWLATLGTSFSTRFEHSQELTDINNAIKSNQEAINLMPDDYASGSGLLLNLGKSFWYRFVLTRRRQDAEAAITHLSSAAASQVGSPIDRFNAAHVWSLTASVIHHPSLLAAYEHVIALMPLVAWLGLPIVDRHQHLTEIGGLTRDAAAAAISLGEYEKALEWLEQGRSIVWTQILQLRTPVNDLHDVKPELADRLVQISRLMEQRPEHKAISHVDMWSTEEQEQGYRALTTERESIIEEIRRLPGFEDFLRPLRASRLMNAAQSGPVVVLNIAKERCDALSVVPGLDEVIHIPLPNVTSERIRSLANELKESLFSSGVRMRGERAATRQTDIDEDDYCKEILGELWSGVVKPVLDSLAFSPHPDTLPRIWWCATGPLAFLPIHAAGIYDQGEVNCHVGDYVISSYTPTLSSLIDPPNTSEESPFKLLSVIQPSAPGASSIPNTKKELDCIRRRLSDREHIILEGEAGTKNRVIKGMEDCNWLHLACHGIQRHDEPTKSALILEDGYLHLEEIIKLNLPNAEFAFLSACQTTTGDEKLSEEAVHIAGGISLAGYRGVVATMWSIQDELAPEVADEFYAHVMRDGKRPDSRQAAEALHLSIQKLRKKGNTPLMAWIPFVHLGV